MAKKQIEDKTLTVSEIAEKSGVTRNKVWSYIRRNNIDPIIKEKGKFKFNSEIVLKIKEKQEVEKANEGKEENNIVSDDVLEIIKKQLKMLEQQFEENQKELKSKKEDIEYWRAEVFRLNAENERNKKLLEDKEKKLAAISSNDLKKAKKHWWQRLFNW